MGIGGSLFLIAVGAILKWAVTADVQGVDLEAVGVILIAVGLVGLAVSLAWLTARRRTDVIHEPNRTTYVAPADPYDRPY